MEKKIFNKGELNKEVYHERVKNYDPRFAEKRFEDYCRSKKLSFKKLLLNADENLFESPIPHWGKLGLMVAQPDYFVTEMINSSMQKLKRVIKSRYEI